MTSSLAPRTRLKLLSLAVLAEAERTGRTPAEIALARAEERSFETHPLWGHRGAVIIQGLVEGGWAA